MISRFGPNARGRKAKNGNILPPRKHQMLQAFLQNFANFITGQLLAAASSDVGGIRDGTEIGISGDAKLGKGSQQTNFLNERGQRIDTGSRGFPVAALGAQCPRRSAPSG